MIIKSEQARGTCDNEYSNKTPHARASHGVVQQGATGRFCEVMWICKTCAIKWAGGEDKILTTEEARNICNAEPRGWADF